MGQLGSAFGNKNTFAPDPQGFNGSEWAARLMGDAGKGLAQGYSNMQNQNAMMRQGGGPTGTPNYNGPLVQQQIYDPTKREQNPFFYGYGPQAGQ